MGIIVVTFYNKDKNEKWERTKIENGTGVISGKNQCVQSVVGNELNHWMELAKEQFDNMSNEDKERLVNKIKEIGDDIKNYDIYKDLIDDANLK